MRKKPTKMLRNEKQFSDRIRTLYIVNFPMRPKLATLSFSNTKLLQFFVRKIILRKNLTTVLKFSRNDVKMRKIKPNYVMFRKTSNLNNSSSKRKLKNLFNSKFNALRAFQQYHPRFSTMNI